MIHLNLRMCLSEVPFWLAWAHFSALAVTEARLLLACTPN